MWLYILLTVVLLLVIFYILFPYQFPTSEIKEALGSLQGPKCVPFFGSIEIFNVPSHLEMDSFQKLFDNYGSRVRIWALGRAGILLNEVEDLQVILASNKNISKDLIYKIMEDWLGDGLLLSSGEKWFKHRKLLTSAFHFKILEHHEETTNQNANIFINNLKKHAEDGKQFDIFPYILNLTLDIICESAMGIKVDAQIKGNEYVKGVKALSIIVTERKSKIWLIHPITFYFTSIGREFRKQLKIVHRFTNKVISERREQFANDKNKQSSNDKKRLSFLDLLLDVSEKDSSFGNKEIREEVDTFMFEGHDTTATALNWCVFLLGNHQDIQDQVIEEVDRANQCQERGEKLRQLQLLERVIKETLRLYPSVPAMSRLLSEPMKLDGLTIPVGVNIPIFPYLLHRNPKIFPDPLKFDPDRFLPENCENRNPFAYIPFSAGPRNCIGQKFAMIEMKLVLAALFSKYRVKSLDLPEHVGVVSELTLKPNRPLRTILINRDDV